MGRHHDQEPVDASPVSAPPTDDFFGFMDEFGQESDRGAVLVVAARIDELLRDAIAARLVQHRDTRTLLDGFNAPLGSLSARILASFSLGILSEEEYRRCNIIRKIRNEFAHRRGVSFTDRKIIDLTESLGRPTRGNENNYRRRFDSVAVTLAAHLNRRAEHVSKERLTWRFWGFTDITG